MRLIIAALACLSLTACATTGPSAGQQIHKMLGASPQYVVDRMGYPSASFTAPNGNQVFAYAQSETATTAEHTYYETYLGSSTTTGGTEYQRTCTVFLEFERNYFVKWSSQGSDCHSSLSRGGRMIADLPPA